MGSEIDSIRKNDVVNLSTARVPMWCARLVLLAPLLALAACADIMRHPAPPNAPPPTFEGFDKVRYYPLDS